MPNPPPPSHTLPLGVRGVGWWWAVPSPSPPTAWLASQAPPRGPSTDTPTQPLTLTRPRNTPPLPQVIGAVVDVEFDNVDDVPEILNSLKIKIMAEKFNVKNDKIRTASLIPKQVRANA